MTYIWDNNGDLLCDGVSSYTFDNANRLASVTQRANTYLYGLARIGEEQPGGWPYHLGDALGSMRPLVNSTAALTLTRSYQLLGDSLPSPGTGAMAFQFTGQLIDQA